MVAELANEGDKLIASGPVEEYEELLTWASKNDLETRFLRNAEQDDAPKS